MIHPEYRRARYFVGYKSRAPGRTLRKSGGCHLWARTTLCLDGFRRHDVVEIRDRVIDSFPDFLSKIHRESGICTLFTLPVVEGNGVAIDCVYIEECDLSDHDDLGHIRNILCNLADRACEGSGEDVIELVLEVVERRCAVYRCTCLKAEYPSFQDIIKTCIIRS